MENKTNKIKELEDVIRWENRVNKNLLIDYKLLKQILIVSVISLSSLILLLAVVSHYQITKLTEQLNESENDKGLYLRGFDPTIQTSKLTYQGLNLSVKDDSNAIIMIGLCEFMDGNIGIEYNEGLYDIYCERDLK